MVDVDHQVDQHIDAIGTDPPGDRLAAFFRHHHEMLHAFANHCADRIGDIAQGVGKHLEASSIVLREHVIDQVAHGMVAEIG